MSVKIIDERYPYNGKTYVMDVRGIESVETSNGIPDCYVHAYDADYGYDYILCGYREGTKIVANPTNTGNETIYLVPEDVANKFAEILNKENHMDMDWIVEGY